MQALIALFDGELRDEMFLLLEMAEIKNYTHFVGLHGSSNQGKKEGSVSWPGSNEIFLLILSNEQVGEFKNIVKKFKEERNTPPGLLTFTWNLQELV